MTTARITVNEKILCPIWPKSIPWATIIRLNSLIWARLIPVRKEVLFVYLNLDVTKIMIRGLIKSMNNIKIISGPIILEKFVNSSSIPRLTKNSVEKKSLNGFTLPIISTLYGRLASATPATNAPIAIEKPK